jgi:WXG100 family type VII secretion target
MSADKGFSVDSDALRAHAENFGDYAAQTGSIHQELTSALEAAGNCWGDDAAGQAFEAGHLASAQEAVGQLGALPDKLTDVGGRFSETATRYEQTEQANADALRAQDHH